VSYGTVQKSRSKWAGGCRLLAQSEGSWGCAWFAGASGVEAVQ